MATRRKAQARLSGWVRLWVVFTALSWLAGVIELTFFAQSFHWQIPLTKVSSQSIRTFLWFLGPILVATAWCATRWVWSGFTPPPKQAAAPYMDTKEIVQGVFDLLGKIFLSALMLVLIAVPLVALAFMDTPPFWTEMLLMMSAALKLFVLMEIWEGEQKP